METYHEWMKAALLITMCGSPGPRGASRIQRSRTAPSESSSWGPTAKNLTCRSWPMPTRAHWVPNPPPSAPPHGLRAGNGRSAKGGFRLGEEQELRALKQRLAEYPKAIRALQASHVLRRPVNRHRDIGAHDVESWARAATNG